MNSLDKEFSDLAGTMLRLEYSLYGTEESKNYFEPKLLASEIQYQQAKAQTERARATCLRIMRLTQDPRLRSLEDVLESVSLMERKCDGHLHMLLAEVYGVVL